VRLPNYRPSDADFRAAVFELRRASRRRWRLIPSSCRSHPCSQPAIPS